MKGRDEYHSQRLQYCCSGTCCSQKVPETSTGPQQRIRNYHKLKQVAAPVAAAVHNVISLLKQIKIAPGTW